MFRSARIAAPLLGALLLGLASPAVAGDEDLSAVAQGDSAFALDLYGRLKEKPGNLFFSPVSVSAALAMTMMGARGNTETEMAKVLRLEIARDSLHPALGALIRDLNSRKIRGEYEADKGKPAFELVIANSLFGQKGYAFLPEFIEGNRKAYNAGFSELDFRSNPEKSRLAINAWVLGKTRKRVKDILAPGTVTPDTRIALANALYFLAPWASQFKAVATKVETFRPGADAPVKVAFMRQMDSFRIGGMGDSDVLILPYRGGDLAMAILLPRTVDGLPALEAGLEARAFWAALRSAAQAEVDVKIPKFKIESTFELKDTLVAMGMKDACSQKDADFSGITGGKELFVGLVAHKTFVAVDENGSEAAAATVVLMGVTGMPPRKEKEFVADHPFLFAIVDLKTETVLFLGRVANPAK
jgi:serpin B